MKKLNEIKDGKLYYNGYDLYSLAKEYKTPLKITFLAVIKEHIEALKKSFDENIKKLQYPAKFIYLNANKANYGFEEIDTAFKYSDGLETSSYYDLLLTYDFFLKHPEFKNKYLVTNGYKMNDYLDEIIRIHHEGYHIIDIIDSLEEYEYLKKSNLKLEIGLRIHLSSQYSEDGVMNDRFGLNEKELEYIYQDLVNTKLNLTTIHFHQRGFDFELDKFLINFHKTFNYYIKFNKKYPSVINLDLGGGTPLPIIEGYDYDEYSYKLLKLILEECKKNQVTVPNLISENGKYSQKDSTVNIYKVVAKKDTDQIPWYVVDSSLLIALPEMYALGEMVRVEAINKLDTKKVKARLAGITCDCDDVYYDKKDEYLLLPEHDDLYIGLLGTGSYQNSMNGKGGVHHCLLPEEKDLVIDVEGNIKIRHNLQTIDEIKKLIKFE